MRINRTVVNREIKSKAEVRLRSLYLLLEKLKWAETKFGHDQFGPSNYGESTERVFGSKAPNDKSDCFEIVQLD
jgi:hypothetical protein